MSVGSSDFDRTKAYSEACGILRHYSNVSFLVRAASFVQGLAIMLPWTQAIATGGSHFTAVFPLAGILFTVLLYRFHSGYFRATCFFYEAAAKMEEQMFPEGFRPIADYDRRHDEELYKSWWNQLTVLHAPFVFIGMLFTIALIIELCRLF